jgi:hypothetical protein
LIKWYWSLITLFAGLSVGLGYGVYRIRHLLLSVTKVGGSPRPPADIKKEVLDELEKDESRDELIKKLKSILEK